MLLFFESFSLTRAFLWVIEAAVLSSLAALVTVARPVDAVHPPVGGLAGEVRAPAALP